MSVSYDVKSMPVVSAVANVVVESLTTLFASAKRGYMNYKTRQALLNLTDAELLDIGLDRAMVMEFKLPR